MILLSDVLSGEVVILFVVCSALLCEFIDSSLGGGYGTIITPLFISVLALNKNFVVVGILISEIITGVLGATSHHFFGNTSFSNTEEGRENWKVWGIVGGLATLAAIGSVFLSTLLTNMGDTGKTIFNLYIGILVTLMGVLMLRKRKFIFSWKRMWVVGAVAGFNKSLSGGGFGPLVTAGQYISGRNLKSAIASALSTESPVCIAGLITYIILQPGIFTVEFFVLALALCVGAIPGCILGALATKILGKNDKKLKYAAAVLVIFLGSYTLLKVLRALLPGIFGWVP
jgi:uncharacterized membrane protein YfcA